MSLYQSAIRNHGFFAILILLPLALICMSCSRSRPAIEAGETRLQVVQEILEQNFQKFATLQGRGKLVVQSPQQSFSGNAVVNIIHPDSIYVRIEAILGLDVGVVFANRERYLIYSPMENLAYVGDASDTLRLKSFLGFDLTFQQLSQYLSGLATLREMCAAKVKMKEDGLHIIGLADSIFYDYTIDTTFGLIARLEMKDLDGRILRIEEYKRFATVNGVRIPQLLRFTRPRQLESLTVYYDLLHVNQPVAAGNFHIKMPADVLKIRL